MTSAENPADSQPRQIGSPPAPAPWVAWSAEEAPAASAFREANHGSVREAPRDLRTKLRLSRVGFMEFSAAIRTIHAKRLPYYRRYSSTPWRRNGPFALNSGRSPCLPSCRRRRTAIAPGPFASGGPGLFLSGEIGDFHRVVDEVIDFGGHRAVLLDAMKFPGPVGPGGVAVVVPAGELGELFDVLENALGSGFGCPACWASMSCLMRRSL